MKAVPTTPVSRITGQNAAQSNFSGVKHPLDLVSRAQAKGWDGFCDQMRLTIGDGTFDIESCRIIRDGS